MAKRKATPRQLMNLAKGREKLFQNQLRRKGINPNPQTQIIREVVRPPVVNHTTTHQHNLKIQLSLFEKFLGTKFFPIEVNKNKETLNIKQIIHHIFSQLDQQRNVIISNQNKISEIIDFVNSREHENNERFKKMDERISKLEEENAQLRKKIREDKNG